MSVQIIDSKGKNHHEILKGSIIHKDSNKIILFVLLEGLNQKARECIEEDEGITVLTDDGPKKTKRHHIQDSYTSGFSGVADGQYVVEFEI